MNSKKISVFQTNFILYFCILFVIIQIVGLFVANYYVTSNMSLGLIDENPNSIWNAIFIISYMLFLTTIILLVKKLFKKTKYLYIFEFIAFYSGALIVFQTIFSPFVSQVIVFYLLFLKYYLKKYVQISLWINNLLLGLALAGASSIIGLSLGILPIVVLLIGLSVYDIIAVFYTKHMQALANIFIKQNISFCFTLPTKKRVFKLGGGDIAIPLMVTSSLFYILIKTNTLFITLIPIVLIWLSSISGLLITFYILEKTKVKALPALPIQCLLMLIVIASSVILL